MTKYNQLSDNQYVCSLHGLVVCSNCDSDFSVYNYLVKLPMDRFGPELETLDPMHRESLARALKAIDRDRVVVRPRNGTPPPSDLAPLSMDRITIDVHDPRTLLLIPELFRPPFLTALPWDLFASVRIPNVRSTTRFVHRQDPTQFLVFAGAVRAWRHSRQYQAGWAFWFRHIISSSQPAMVSARLEDTSFATRSIAKTQDRIDIRVLIAILQSRRWAAEGFNTLIIATPSDYVLRGITSQLRIWLSSEWQNPMPREMFYNRDLWQIFLSEVDKCKSEGLEVKIWQVLRSMTEVVDMEATRAAMAN